MFIETPRLVIRDYTLEDSGFVLQMLNEPTYIENIRDNGIRSIEDARQYISEKILKNIQIFGFGYHVIARKSDMRPIGQCGIVLRSFLTDPDIGFSFLMEFQNMGFGFEAVSAYMKSSEVNQFKKLHAFTSIVNPGSQKLLLKLGFHDDGIIKYDNTDEDVKLFTRTF